jgi:hypothetical protein
MSVTPISYKNVLTRIKAGIAPIVPDNICKRTRQLLFNPLTASHFSNQRLEAANTKYLIERFDYILNHLPDNLERTMKRIDNANPKGIIVKATEFIWDFISQTKYTLPPELINKNDPEEFVEAFFRVENGENDLRQLFSGYLIKISEHSSEGIKYDGAQEYKYFISLYCILRASELIAGKQKMPIYHPPFTGSDISKVSSEPEASMLEAESRRVLLPLVMIAGRMKSERLNKWMGTLRKIISEEYPEKILDKMRNAIDSFKEMPDEEVVSRTEKFMETIRKELKLPLGEHVHDRQEIYDRTLGHAQSILETWVLEKVMPGENQLDELESSLKMALICYKYLLENIKE